MSDNLSPGADLNGSGDGMDDLRAGLAEALNASRETSTPAERTPVPASAPEGEHADGKDPVRDTPTDEPSAEGDKSDRPRDEKGRFAPSAAEKAASEAAKGQEPAKDAPGHPPSELPHAPRVAPPPGWSPTAKAEFAKASPAIQEAVAKREEEINAGFAQLRDYRQLQQELQPVAEFARANGATIRQVFDRYQDAERNLVQRPVETIAAFCEFARIHPAQVLQYVQQRQGYSQAQGQPQQQPQAMPQPQYAPQPQRMPQVPTRDDIATEAKRVLEEERMQSEIESFFKSPEFPYAENLRPDMAILLKNGRADSLKDAYDKAVWANPETRQLLINQQREEEERKAAEKARAAASKAREGAKSISGSPLPGGASMPPPMADMDLHEQLAANMRASRSQV